MPSDCSIVEVKDRVGHLSITGRVTVEGPFYAGERNEVIVDFQRKVHSLAEQIEEAVKIVIFSFREKHPEL